MFPHSYFAASYFAPIYFPPALAAVGSNVWVLWIDGD